MPNYVKGTRSTTFSKKFKELLKTNERLTASDGDCLYVSRLKPESFRQCYCSRNSDSPFKRARQQLPKNWFLDDKGHLITTLPVNDNYWLKPFGTTGQYSGRGGKQISAYSLQLLVFGDESNNHEIATPYALTRLQKLGLSAFGTASTDVQTDHRLQNRLVSDDGHWNEADILSNADISYTWFTSSRYNLIFRNLDAKKDILLNESENADIGAAMSDYIRTYVMQTDVFSTLIREWRDEDEDSFEELTTLEQQILSGQQPHFFIKFSSDIHYLKIATRTDRLINYDYFRRMDAGETINRSIELTISMNDPGTVYNDRLKNDPDFYEAEAERLRPEGLLPVVVYSDSDLLGQQGQNKPVKKRGRRLTRISENRKHKETQKV